MSPSQTKEAQRAHNAVWTAIFSGRLKPPEHCEQCGSRCQVDAHHDDYSKPLDIRWFCKSCHTAYHLWQRGKIASAWCTWVDFEKWRHGPRIWTVHKTQKQAIANARAINAKPGWTAMAIPRPIPSAPASPS